jgi:hypothetical protein
MLEGESKKNVFHTLQQKVDQFKQLIPIMLKVNLKGTRNESDACRQYIAPTIVQTSSKYRITIRDKAQPK